MQKKLERIDHPHMIAKKQEKKTMERGDIYTKICINKKIDLQCSI